MYLTKKLGLVTLLTIFVFAFVTTGVFADGQSVEEIYDSIRNSNPELGYEESIETFTNEGKTLVCTLALPSNGEKCPVVITLAGFIGTRDEEPIPGTSDTVFGRQCRVLAQHGIASLRVDFRGYGDSDGEFHEASFSSQISDILAALDFICDSLKHKVDKKRIGILGFSQGGLVGTTVGARDKRVKSLVLWSPATNPPRNYQELLTADGIKKGLALEEGETDMFSLYMDGEYVFWDVELGHNFFQDLFKYDPVAEIKDYKNPLMVIVGTNDPLLWPQPVVGNILLKYHTDGYEKLVAVEAGHEFDYWAGPDVEKLDDAIYWGAAMFIKTLK